MHQSSFEKMSAFKDRYLKSSQGAPLKILDLGSQDVNGSYKPIFNDPRWNYVGVDLAPGKNVDIVLDNPYKWTSVKTESIDIVVSGQAFEHIDFFWLTMLEVERVLKPGGRTCIIAPSTGPEHRHPTDCWRFYSDGMRALANFVGLDIEEASTQWEPPDYPDGCQIWKDSMLIATKRKASFYRRARTRICSKLLRQLGSF